MKNRTASILFACLAIFAASLLSIPAVAQEPENETSAFKTALSQDLDNLSQKYVGLAQAMEGKYDWRPGEGVRSVGDVFNLIVMENGMIAGLISGTPMSPESRPDPITDPARLQEALTSSYANLKEQILAMPESKLSETIQFFGRETTLHGALFMMLMDQHEHLGQSIAYARTNNVTPPWSRQSE